LGLVHSLYDRRGALGLVYCFSYRASSELTLASGSTAKGWPLGQCASIMVPILERGFGCDGRFGPSEEGIKGMQTEISPYSATQHRDVLARLALRNVPTSSI
jgi:hypothetical protein